MIMKKVIGIFLLIAGIVLTVIGGFFVFEFFFGKSQSVGIIGGADGPTAVFVTSKLGVFPIVAVAVGIVIVIISAMVLRKNKSK